MKIYISSAIRYVKKINNYMYIYLDGSSYRAADPIQLLFDLFLDGVSDFNLMLQLLKSKYQIEGSLDDIRSIVLNNDQFLDVFTFEENNNIVKVYGDYKNRFPIELHVEITNACNLNCSHCYKKANEGNIVFLNFNALKKHLLDVCAEQVRILHLTGGEPSLHPEFKDIVDYASRFYQVQLTTNGANLWNIPISTIKRITNIDISMYGTNQESYKENTGDLYAYNFFEKSCTLLKENNIDFRINMIVNRKNAEKIDQYVQKAIKLGARSFSLGLPTKTGRLIDKPNMEWNIDSNLIKNVYRYMRMANKKYKDEINIVEWGRDVYTHRSNIMENDYALPCKGGTLSWWMNEKMEFRPCAMIPAEYILLSYEKWRDYCEIRFNLNWRESYMNFKNYCSETKINPEDICYVFKEDTHESLM